MAEQALKKLKEQLQCGICLDTYTDPKQLQCNHVYCRKCLVKTVFRDEKGELVLTCPTCRQVTPIPARGVAGLQAAFHINNLFEIRDSVEMIGESEEGTVSDSVSDSICENPSKSEVKSCSVHPEEELKLFCETCQELICYQCAIKGGKHQSHDHQLLSKAFERYKQEITSSLEPIEKQLSTINKALAQLDARCGKISDKQAAIEANIDESIQQLHETLDARRTELIGQLQQITERKLQDLAIQRDQLETTQVQLSSYLDFVRESLKTSSLGDVLMAKPITLEQVKELTTPLQPDILKPNTEADMMFSTLANITAACQSYGKITVPVKSTLDSSKFLITEHKGVAAVGKMSSIALQVASFSSEEPICSLECELVSEITGTRTRGTVERKGRSQYEISYQPTIKGRHQLHIKFCGQHIRGSPLSIAVKSPIELLGTSIFSIGGVDQPWGITVNQQGCLIVTEHGRHCVSVFSPSGEKLQSFGKLGSGHGEFEYPCGVAVDGKGNILVIDNHNHRIQQFTAEGQFITSVGTKGSGPLEFYCPRDVTFNASNNKLYIACEHRVQVLNSDLTFCTTFGQEGTRAGEFRYPHGIACDSTGNVYVADSVNHRIQVFTAEGKFLRMFGRKGAGKGEMDFPIGIGIDASDRVYVSERYNGRVSVFNSEGECLTSFGDEAGELHHPIGLEVSTCGLVFVCTSCIQLF